MDARLVLLVVAVCANDMVAGEGARLRDVERHRKDPTGYVLRMEVVNAVCIQDVQSWLEEKEVFAFLTVEGLGVPEKNVINWHKVGLSFV